MHDIETLDDIKKVVNGFYGKVRHDELLGPVFEEKIGDNWDRHLDTMHRFWQTVLLQQGQTYTGNPFSKHAELLIGKEHFERWLQLWKETLQENYEGPVTTDAIERSYKMAQVFQVKLESLRNSGGKAIF